MKIKLVNQGRRKKLRLQGKFIRLNQGDSIVISGVDKDDFDKVKSDLALFDILVTKDKAKKEDVKDGE